MGYPLCHAETHVAQLTASSQLVDQLGEEWSQAGKADVDETIDLLLELPQNGASRRRRQAVLVLDEFQEIVALGRELPARMRAAFQFQPDVAHVYLGSRQHLLRKVVTDADSPLYNSAKVFPLGPIPRDAFSRFLTDRFASTSIGITDDTVSNLLSITDGHHDTQKLAAALDTVQLALATAIATDTARFTELWDGLTTNQRRLLEAIGRAEPIEVVLSEGFRRRHRLGPYATVERALDSLVERGLVEREGRGRVIVPDVFFIHWLRAPDR